MRESYHLLLEDVTNDLVHMTDEVRVAVRDATQALLQADLTMAEQVISNDARLDATFEDIERRCFMLLARQAPVAGELRTIVAALRMDADLGRMGDLAAHIAKVARLRYPAHTVPDSLTHNVTRMAEVAEQMVANAGDVLKKRDIKSAQLLAKHDEEIDGLRREQFRIVLDKEWSHGVEAAVDMALIGRYYERIADHAVALAGRLIYLVTGEAPEGDEWPTT